MDDEHDVTPGWKLAGEVAGAPAGGLIALMGGPFAAVLGATAASVFATIISRGDRKSAHNVRRVIHGATQEAAMTPEQMIKAINTDDQRLGIAAAAVRSAMTTLSEQKVDALARVVGEALRDGARLDVCWLMMQALSDLEAPHIRVLHAMATEKRPVVPGIEAGLNPQTWRLRALEAHMPNLQGGLIPIMAALERHGLVQEGLAEDPDNRVWTVTSFGTACLGYLNQLHRMNTTGT